MGDSALLPQRPGQHVFHLYELLFNNVCHLECESTSRAGNHGSDFLRPRRDQAGGFRRLRRDASLSPAGPFPGYLLLFEYFCFPEKFLFFDLSWPGSAPGSRLRRHPRNPDLPGQDCEIESPGQRGTFCLHATPVVNLFQRIAEPIRVEQQKTEYHVIPDIRRLEATEIFSVDRVTSSPATSSGKETDSSPFIPSAPPR